MRPLCVIQNAIVFLHKYCAYPRLSLLNSMNFLLTRDPSLYIQKPDSPDPSLENSLSSFSNFQFDSCDEDTTEFGELTKKADLPKISVAFK
jgi:hypothetical protein